MEGPFYCCNIHLVDSLGVSDHDRNTTTRIGESSCHLTSTSAVCYIAQSPVGSDPRLTNVVRLDS